MRTALPPLRPPHRGGVEVSTLDAFVPSYLATTSYDVAAIDPASRFEDDLARAGIVDALIALGVSLETEVLGPDEVWIQNFKAQRQGGGAGTRGLALLCELADDHGVTLCLSAKPYGDAPMAPDVLVRFYARAGFAPSIPHPDAPEVEDGLFMRRYPRSM